MIVPTPTPWTPTDVARQHLAGANLRAWAVRYAAHLGAALERVRRPDKVLRLPTLELQYSYAGGWACLHLRPASFPRTCLLPGHSPKEPPDAGAGIAHLVREVAGMASGDEEVATFKLARDLYRITPDVLDAVHALVMSDIGGCFPGLRLTSRLGWCQHPTGTDRGTCGAFGAYPVARDGTPHSICETCQAKMIAEARHRDHEEALRRARETGEAHALDALTDSPIELSRLGCGHLYLLRDASTGLIKIGRTKQLPERVTGCLTAATVRLELVLAVPCMHERLPATEAALHQRFRRYRVHGEWFRLPAKHVTALRREYPEPASRTIALARAKLRAHAERVARRPTRPSTKSASRLAARRAG